MSGHGGIQLHEISSKPVSTRGFGLGIWIRGFLSVAAFWLGRGVALVWGNLPLIAWLVGVSVCMRVCVFFSRNGTESVVYGRTVPGMDGWTRWTNSTTTGPAGRGASRPGGATGQQEDKDSRGRQIGPWTREEGAEPGRAGRSVGSLGWSVGDTESGLLHRLPASRPPLPWLGRGGGSPKEGTVATTASSHEGGGPSGVERAWH